MKNKPKSIFNIFKKKEKTSSFQSIKEFLIDNEKKDKLDKLEFEKFAKEENSYPPIIFDGEFEKNIKKEEPKKEVKESEFEIFAQELKKNSEPIEEISDDLLENFLGEDEPEKTDKVSEKTEVQSSHIDDEILAEFIEEKTPEEEIIIKNIEEITEDILNNAPEEIFSNSPNEDEEDETSEDTEVDLDDEIDEDDEDDEEPNNYDNFFEDCPIITKVSEYRDKTIPTQVVNIDNLNSAISNESKHLKNFITKQSGSKNANIVSGFYFDDQQMEERRDDYIHPKYAQTIETNLKIKTQSLSLSALVTFLLSAIMFFLTSMNEVNFSNDNTFGNPMSYIVTSLLLLLIAVGFSYKSVYSGIKSLIKFQANADSPMSIVVLATIAQLIFALFNKELLLDGTVHIYALIPIFAIFANAGGKILMFRRIHSNFKFLTSREQKYAVRLLNDYNMSLKITEDCVTERPVVAYQKRTTFLKRFLQISNEPDPSEVMSRNLTPLLLIFSLILCFVMIIVTGNIFLSVSVFTASTCASCAVANLICINLPLSRFCKKARRSGAMVSSYYAVAEMSKTNAVLIDTSDLFPRGSVNLDGIKFYGEQDKTKAISYALSLTNTVGGIFRDLFEQVDAENVTSTMMIDEFQIEGENGISGSINLENILIGDRNLLLKYGIEPPPKEEVIPHIRQGKKVFFVAIAGELTAMLIVNYTADKRKKAELKKLENNGISIVIRSSDTNVTEKLICKLFDLSSSSIKVVNGELGESARRIIKSTIPRADAIIATKGNMTSMIRVLVDCLAQKKMVDLLVTMQCLGMVLGIFLVALLSISNSYPQLSSMSIFIYQVFWAIVLILIPKFKRM